MDKTFLAPLGRVEGGPGKVLGGGLSLLLLLLFQETLLEGGGKRIGRGGGKEDEKDGRRDPTMLTCLKA